METVNEAICRLQEQKERSQQRTQEYHTKCLLEILNKLDDLTARVARIEEEILSASVGK